MERILHSPGGNYWVQGKDILNDCTHILVAGSTGSGKSVFINSLLHSILADSPANNALYLIDPKRVELSRYKNVPIVYRYGCTSKEIKDILEDAIAKMEDRYRMMERASVRSYSGSHLWVVIDELADLMLTDKKTFLPLLQKIGQLGRAARVHLICATQSPSRAVIPAQLQVNFSHKLCLKCDTAIESRQVIGVSGGEALPQNGEGILRSPKGLTLLPILMFPDEDIQDRINQWIELNKGHFGNLSNSKVNWSKWHD